MAVRTGQQYIEGLKDGRVVYLGSEKIDVTTDPRMRGSLMGMAGYFDWQNAHADDCLAPDEASDRMMSASHILPKNKADLDQRHRCFDRLAQYSRGMLGRTPDYVNVSLAGQVARADVWANGKQEFYENLKAFRRHVVENDLSLTHTLVNASIDRAAGELRGMNADMALRVVKRDERGITVRGARLLATLGPFADELFVYPSAPMFKGQEDYALCFAIPVSTKGVIQLARDHYGVDHDVQDFPFSARFDEQDSFVIFDDVLVPWDRVFVDGDIATYNSISPGVFPGCVAQQTSIRARVKLGFAYDLCVQMAKIQNSEGNADIARLLGELYGYYVLTNNMILSAEARAFDWGAGAFFPHGDLAILRTLMPEWMVRVNEIIELIGSHHLLTTPSMGLFDDPKMGPVLTQYLPSADGREAKERAQIFRTAWDFVGSSLGSRVKLYERNYLGSRMRALQADHMIGQMSNRWNDVSDFMAAIPVAGHP